ncbi:hypothetical protein F7725_019286, partial [Dissostichus mawsoni]
MNEQQTKADSIWHGGSSFPCSVVSVTFFLCTADLNEPSDDSKVSTDKEDCLGSMTAEETVVNIKIYFPCEKLRQSLKYSSPYRMRPCIKRITRMKTRLQLFMKMSFLLIEMHCNLGYLCLFAALSSDSEPQASSAPCPDLMNLVEEVTCLVGGIRLTEVCTDQRQEAEKEEGKQPVGSPPEETEDVSSSELEEQQSSSADDSF